MVCVKSVSGMVLRSTLKYLREVFMKLVPPAFICKKNEYFHVRISVNALVCNLECYRQVAFIHLVVFFNPLFFPLPFLDKPNFC